MRISLRLPGLCILPRRQRCSWQYVFFLLIGVACVSIVVFTAKESLEITRQQVAANKHRLAGRTVTVNEPTNVGDLSLNYGIVVDCGSSGSRVFVYFWPPHSGEERHLLNIQLMRDVNSKPVVKKIEPGLSSYVDTPSDASDHVAQLLEFAASFIPKLKYRETSAYIMATAGMRLLSTKDQEAILNDLRVDLHLQFDFLFSSSHVEVISGKQEGIYSWISVNYALGKFDHKINDADKLIAVEVPGMDKLHIRKRSVGMLDLGGASLQVAFEVPKSEEVAKGLLAEFNLGCSNSDLDHVYRVYVATFLGIGSNSARAQYEYNLVLNHTQAMLSGFSYKTTTSNNASNDVILLDPCLPLNKLDSISHGDQKIILKGTGNLEDCIHSILPLLNKTACTYKPPCVMHGIYQPEINFDNSEFYGFSEFHYTMEDVLRIGGKYDYAHFRRSAQRYCSTNWTRIASWQSEGMFPRADSNRYRLQCFKSAWMLAVLHEGLDFPHSYNHLTSVQFINNDEVHWSLGALLYKTKFFPLRDIEKQRSAPHQLPWTASDLPKSSSTLTIFLFILILLVCLYLLIRRMNGPAGLHRVPTMAYYMTDSGDDQEGVRYDRARNIGNYLNRDLSGKS